MLTLFKRHWVQIAVILSVFGLFVANAVGVLGLILGVADSDLSHMAILRSPEFILLIIVGITLSVSLPLLDPLKASALMLATMAPIGYMGSLSPLARKELGLPMEASLVPLEYSLFTILMLFVANVLITYFAETSKKQRLIEAFGQFVPPQVAAQISQNPEQFTLEGESRELSVMFCDVHNFTGMAEQLGPKQLAQLLNTVFTPLTEVLYKHHATIDKYIGDAIMAFWGAPIEDPFHARNAVSAAVEMQDVVKQLAPTFERNGWPELTIGIGINTGVMNVGNMGSKYRMAYTVIGDAVNLAARLQEVTSFYKTEIIVGEETKKAFALAVYRELGLVRVKGKNSFARIFEPSNPSADPESTMIENMNNHNKALQHYYQREWDLAEVLFEKLRERRVDDPLYPYFLSRITEYRQNPPDQDWRGQVDFRAR